MARCFLLAGLIRLAFFLACLPFILGAKLPTGPADLAPGTYPLYMLVYFALPWLWDLFESLVYVLLDWDWMAGVIFAVATRRILADRAWLDEIRAPVGVTPNTVWLAVLTLLLGACLFLTAWGWLFDPLNSLLFGDPQPWRPAFASPLTVDWLLGTNHDHLFWIIIPGELAGQATRFLMLVPFVGLAHNVYASLRSPVRGAIAVFLLHEMVHRIAQVTIKRPSRDFLSFPGLPPVAPPPPTFLDEWGPHVYWAIMLFLLIASCLYFRHTVARKFDLS